MKSMPSYDHLPWELIVASLQDELTSDEEAQFSKWLSESKANGEIYATLQRIWLESLEKYPPNPEESADRSFSLRRWRVSKKGVSPTQTIHNKILMMLRRIFPPWK